MKKIFDKNQRFSICSYKEMNSDDWDNFVDNNETGYTYHYYNNIILDEGLVSQNISFAIFDNTVKKIVLLMPLYIKKGNNKLICRKGFVIKDGLTKKYMNKVSLFFMSCIDNILGKYNLDELCTELPALIRSNLPNRIHQLVNPLIFFGFEPKIRYTWIVDLGKEENRIIADCEQTTRQAIRRFIGDRKYVFSETSKSTINKDICDFVSLAKITYKEFPDKGNNEDYYKNVILTVNNNYCRVFFVREKDSGIPICSAIIHISRNTAHYSFGVSIDEKPVGIFRYLIYSVMLELRKSGIIYFETGGAYPYLRNSSKMKGISDFKRCFGTFLHPIHMGVFNRRVSY